MPRRSHRPKKTSNARGTANGRSTKSQKSPREIPTSQVAAALPRPTECICRWINPTSQQVCGASFRNFELWKEHEKRYQHYSPFWFLRLPPDVRNLIYDIELGEVKYFVGKDDHITYRPEKMGLGLLSVNRQVHGEGIMFIYEKVTLEVSGRNWCSLRAFSQQEDPGRRVLRSARQNDQDRATALQNLVGQLDARKKEKRAQIWGYSPKGLQLDNRMAKYVKHWVIAIDCKQYDGDLLWPTMDHPTFPKILEKQHPGVLSYNFLQMTPLVRLFESCDTTPESVTIRMYNSSGNENDESIPHSSFLPCHLMDSLRPLRAVRGLKKLSFDKRLQEFMQNNGHGEFLVDLKEKAQSKKWAKGDIKDMMKRLNGFYESFHPHNKIRARIRHYSWLMQMYDFPEYKSDWNYLCSIMRERLCWASFAALRDRMITELSERMDQITIARAQIGTEFDNAKLVDLFNAFMVNNNSEVVIQYTVQDFPISLFRYTKTRRKMHEWCGAMDEIMAAEIHSERHHRRYQRMMDHMDEVIGSINAAYELVKADRDGLESVSEPGDSSSGMITSNDSVVDERSEVDKSLDALLGRR